MRKPPYFNEYLSEEGNTPLLQKCKARKFVSRSKGLRNGKRCIRKQEKDIILLKYGERWKYWDGGDHNHNGNIPFDQWATEIYGLPFCESLTEHPDDYIRHDILTNLKLNNNNF